MGKNCLTMDTKRTLNKKCNINHMSMTLFSLSRVNVQQGKQAIIRDGHYNDAAKVEYRQI